MNDALGPLGIPRVGAGDALGTAHEYKLIGTSKSPSAARPYGSYLVAHPGGVAATITPNYMWEFEADFAPGPQPLPGLDKACKIGLTTQVLLGKAQAPCLTIFDGDDKEKSIAILDTPYQLPGDGIESNLHAAEFFGLKRHGAGETVVSAQGEPLWRVVEIWRDAEIAQSIIKAARPVGTASTAKETWGLILAFAHKIQWIAVAD